MTYQDFGKGFYCLNYLIDFRAGEYICYETGPADDYLAFIIGDANKANPNPPVVQARGDDPWAHAIWYTSDNNEVHLQYMEELQKKWEAYKKVKDSTQALVITPPTTDVIEATSELVGPFKIEYPYEVLADEFVDIQISINNNILYNSNDESVQNKLVKADGTAFKIGDTEFYIPVSETNYGDINNIKLSWNFKYYTASYAKFTPKRVLNLTYICNNCGNSITYQVEGYKYSGYTGNYSLMNPVEISRSENFEGGIDFNSGIHYANAVVCGKTTTQLEYSDGYTELQDLIYLEEQENVIPDEVEISVIIGKPNIEIEFDKIDSVTKERLAGAQFEITVENGTAEPSQIITTTDTSKIVIKPNNGGKDITEMKVHIKETSPSDPDKYMNYVTDIILTYTWNSESVQWELTNEEYPKNEQIATSFVEKNKWSILAANRQKIELSGIVWIDEPTGEKKIDPPNGYKDANELGKSGVKVYLVKSNGEIVREDGQGNTIGTNGYLVTNSAGEYKFENIPSDDYYIVFEYDGINYIRTVDGQSDATEKNRATYNSRFKTITRGQSNDGTTLEYNYDGSSISTLITEDSNGEVLQKFAVQADTLPTTYNVTTTGIDLGLRKKVVDLSLVTDIYKANVSINGKQEEYTYNYFDDMNYVLSISQNKTAGDAVYNLNLYNSDYDYRIGDYNLIGAHASELTAAEIEALQASRQELTVDLTYAIIINNQSTTESQVHQIAYYYDSNFTPISITNGTIVSNSGNKLIIEPSVQNVGYGGQLAILIQFRVNIQNLNSVQYTNYGEIIAYSTTEGGYVDCDSAPDNAFETSTFKYEDDSDEAHGIKLEVVSNTREISGYVFEDNKTVTNNSYITGNGLFDNGESKINDVIVQLIEIKDVTVGGNIYKLEYIWQETTSGANLVTALSMDGQRTDVYTVEPETGKYTFTNFIPGNYIVRFIYGDDEYYDVAIDENNILKYNGQDYKSTVDTNYLGETFNSSNYSSDSSMARDNEARRLEVMAYSLQETDISKLYINDKSELENTWMCAETSKVNVADVMINEGETQFKQQTNFGLVKRPQTSISLEKHITYVSLKGGEANMNIEASANIGDYSNDTTEISLNKASESHPITAQATTYQNRGYWQVETNKIDGADLKINYTYVIKNAGEKEYLHQNLINTFIGGTEQEYIDAIKARIANVKDSIKNNSYSIANSYLGEAYYTGVQGSNDGEVSAEVKIEDYINNQFTFTSSDLQEVGTAEKSVIGISDNVDMEDVKVLQTTNGYKIPLNGQLTFEATLTRTGLSSTDNLEFHSYIAQVIAPKTNAAGSIILGTIPNDLDYVQSYSPLKQSLESLGTEADEYWAETFRIIPSTGGDKFTPIVLMMSITGGLVIVAVGIVFIKKYVIK